MKIRGQLIIIWELFDTRLRESVATMSSVGCDGCGGGVGRLQKGIQLFQGSNNNI